MITSIFEFSFVPILSNWTRGMINGLATVCNVAYENVTCFITGETSQ